MLTAIIYSSQTGSCERYARELSRTLHLPCEPLKSCKVRSDGKVIYVGWLMAGKVYGLSSAISKLDVAAVVGVGMGPVTADSAAQGHKANRLPAHVPYFQVQGGLHLAALKPPMRLAMRLVNKSIAVKLREKAEKTPLNAQEQATLRMALTGDGEPAAWDCEAVIDWARKQNGFLTKARELAK